MVNNKKSIGAVIAVSLLFVVAVFSVVGFNNWYDSYSSNMFSKIQIEADDSLNKNEIVNLIGSKLYFKNSLSRNLNILKVKVNLVECTLFDMEWEPGMNEIELYDCVESFINDSRFNIKVFDETNIYSKIFNIESLVNPRILDSDFKYFFEDLNETAEILGTFSDLTDIAVSGNYAFATYRNSNSLAILDISNKLNISIVSFIQNITSIGNAGKILINGNYAYIGIDSQWYNNLVIVDISDPLNPFVTDMIDSSNMGTYKDFVLDDDYIYYINIWNTRGLTILNVSDKYNIEIVINKYVNSTYFADPDSIDVSGNYVYIADGNGDSFTILDVSIKNSPVIVSFYQNSTIINNPTNINVVGNYVYISGGYSDNFVSFDVSDKANPIYINQTYDDTYFNYIGDVFIEGDLAYVNARYGASFCAVNISNPYFLNIEGCFRDTSIYSYPERLSKSGDFIFSVIDDSENILIHDVSDLSSISLEADFSDPSLHLESPTDIYVEGDLGYLISSNKFYIMNLTNKNNPFVISMIINSTLLAGAEELVLKGNVVFVAAEDSHSLVAIDISDNFNPFIIGNLTGTNNFGAIDNIYGSGNYVYVGINWGNHGLTIVNISDPYNMKVEGFYYNSTLFGNLDDIYVEDNYVYLVSAHTETLSIIDISNKSNPVLVSNFTNSTYIKSSTDIGKKGDYLYITETHSAANLDLSVFDVSDVNNIIPVRDYHLSYGGSPKIAIDSIYAYISFEWSNLITVYDIFYPENIVLKNTFSCSRPRRVRIFDNYIYCLSAYDELFIFNILAE